MKIQSTIQPQKINVMQCRSTYTTGGGPDKTALLIAEKANPEKFRIILMYMRGADDKEFQIGRWARERGLTIHEVLEHGKLSVANLKEIHQLIRQYQIDILHTRDYKTAIVGYLLSFFNPKLKLLFTSHLWQDLDSLKMKLYTWLNLFALRKYHKVIAVSEDLRDFMIQRGVAAEKITVLHNAIDVDAWKHDAIVSTIREELQIPSGSYMVGVVGRLRYEKDLPTTLRVAEKVMQTLPETYFIIVGDGPDRPELEHQVQQMGLAEKIRFLGFRKDTMHIYAGLDVFASTARIEGTPNTALEAMAMEVPVVYTKVGGVGEIIQDGYNGLLYDIGDVEGIARGIISILTDREKAARLRENGRRSVCEQFSFAKRLKAIETIYEELVNQ